MPKRDLSKIKKAVQRGKSKLKTKTKKHMKTTNWQKTKSIKIHISKKIIKVKKIEHAFSHSLQQTGNRALPLKGHHLRIGTFVTGARTQVNRMASVWVTLGLSRLQEPQGQSMKDARECPSARQPPTEQTHSVNSPVPVQLR